MLTSLAKAASSIVLGATLVARPVMAADSILGPEVPDVLVGSAQSETIRGYGGLDKINGKGGDDRIWAGMDRKRDVVRGGSGNDLIYAKNSEHVSAGPGDDVIRVGKMHTFMLADVWCGAGRDHVYGTPGWLLSVHRCEKVTPWPGDQLPPRWR